MQTFFRYNWIVREQWYRWCEEVPAEELLRQRTGGVGSILRTLFHVVDVEWSWIRVLQGQPDFEESFDGYASLEKVRELDRLFRPDVEDFVNRWEDSFETRTLYNDSPDGKIEKHAWGEVIRHVIAHEIHHMGQLSVWSRELGRAPVSANVIRKGLIEPAESAHS